MCVQVHADMHTHTRTNTLMHTHRLPLSTSERDVKREAEEGGGGPRAEGRRRPPDGRTRGNKEVPSPLALPGGTLPADTRFPRSCL